LGITEVAVPRNTGTGSAKITGTPEFWKFRVPAKFRFRSNEQPRLSLPRTNLLVRELELELTKAHMAQKPLPLVAKERDTKTKNGRTGKNRAKTGFYFKNEGWCGYGGAEARRLGY